MSISTLPRSEWRRLTSSFDPLKTVVGLALIPLLYAGVYLYANWDPYGNMDQVDAALVNLDQGSEVDGEHRTLGDDVVEDLVEDGSFGWQMVSTREEAEQATARGDHHFALIIPEDFSAALTSPADLESAERAQLEIVTNEANNYLLSSIVEVLANELHEAVSEEVGRETADQMLTGFGQIHQQLLEAAEGTAELRSGNDELHAGLGELTEGAVTLKEGAGELDDGMTALHTGLAPLAEGTQELRRGAGELRQGASELHSGLVDLDDGAGDLQEGLSTLAHGAGELDTGLGELSTGAEQVALGNEQLSSASQEATDLLTQIESAGQERLEHSVQALIDSEVITQEQAEEASAALAPAVEDSELADSAQTVGSELHEAQESIDELALGARQVANGAAELSEGSADLSSGSSALVRELPSLTSGLGQARTGAYALSDGSAELAEGARTANAGVAQVQEGAAELTEGTGALAEGTDDLHEGLTDAEDGAEELTEGAGELASALDSGAQEVPNPDDGQQEELTEVIGNPLHVSQEAQAEAGSYGAGMAPFFMGLSLWIGGLVMLQVLRPLSPRALASNASSLSIALGSWIPFLMLSLVQSLALYAMVVFGIGLSPAHPLLTLAVLGAASMAFSALIHGLVALLGNPGKFIAIVLLVLQLVAAGGTFPSQALPGALAALNPVLPLSYVIDGLRHVIYGADLGVLSGSLAALGATTLIGLGILLLAVKKHRMWDLDRLHPPFEEAA